MSVRPDRCGAVSGEPPSRLPRRHRAARGRLIVARLRILFVLSGSLGWKTYQQRIMEVAQRREDVDAVFHLCQATLWERALMRRLPGTTLRRLADPIFVWRQHFRRWWQAEGRHLGIDAVHVATQLNALAFAELAPSLPFSVYIDITRRAGRADFGPAAFSRRALEAEEEVFRRASFIAAMSRWNGRSLQEDYGIPEERILVCPPSVALPPPSGARSGDGLPNIAFVGNDFHRKGGDLLLEVHQRHLTERAVLHIVSRQAPDESGLRNIKVYRSVPNAELVREFYPRMDLFCLPTRSDMSSWVVAEASAAALPVVTTAVGGIGDLVVEGVTGFVVGKDDREALRARLLALLDDRPLRETMGRRARSHAENSLNAERTYGRLIDRIVASVRQEGAAARPDVPAL
jgi:glycosyltransferase involved in cell wall biosynthesis